MEVIWLTLRLKVLMRNFILFWFSILNCCKISSHSSIVWVCKDSIRKKKFTSLKIFNAAFEIGISANCIIPVTRGFEQRNLNSFDTSYSFTICLSPSRENTILILLSLIYFFHKQFAKTDRICKQKCNVHLQCTYKNVTASNALHEWIYLLCTCKEKKKTKNNNRCMKMFHTWYLRRLKFFFETTIQCFCNTAWNRGVPIQFIQMKSNFLIYFLKA